MVAGVYLMRHQHWEAVTVVAFELTAQDLRGKVGLRLGDVEAPALFP
jgi:hypothetical protein